MPPFSCNSKFEDEGNPSCSFDAYEGGFRCCEHGVFLLDTSVHDVSKEETTEFFFKVRLVAALRPCASCLPRHSFRPGSRS